MNKKILKNFHLGVNEEVYKVYDDMHLRNPAGKGNFILTSQRLIFSGNVRGQRGAITIESSLKDVNGGIKAGYNKTRNKVAKAFGAVFILIGFIVAVFGAIIYAGILTQLISQISILSRITILNTINTLQYSYLIMGAGGGIFLLGVLISLIKSNVFYLEILSKSQSNEFLKFSTKDKKSKDVISQIYVNPDKKLKQLVLNLGTDILNAQQFSGSKKIDITELDEELDLFGDSKKKKKKKAKKEKISLLDED
ncbi:MAG: hypothetical protein ACOX4W_01255 [Bacilli bacterium]